MTYEEQNPVPGGFASWDEWRRYNQIQGPLGPSGLPTLGNKPGWTPAENYSPEYAREMAGMEYMPARGLTISRETPQQAERRSSTDPYITLDKKISMWKEAHRLNFDLDMQRAGENPFLQQIAMQEYTMGLDRLNTERETNKILLDAINRDPDANSTEKYEASIGVLGKLSSPISLVGVTRAAARQENVPLTSQELQKVEQYEIPTGEFADNPTPKQIREQIRQKEATTAAPPIAPKAVVQTEGKTYNYPIPYEPGMKPEITPKTTVGFPKKLPPTIMGPGPEYDKLPVGALYYDNKGNLRRKK